MITRSIADTTTTTDACSRLIIGTRKHTTDILINSMTQSAQTHTADVFVTRTSRIRQIISLIRKSVPIPSGYGIGVYSVSILGVSGNAMTPPLFTSNQPNPAVRVGGGVNSTVFVDNQLAEKAS